MKPYNIVLPLVLGTISENLIRTGIMMASALKAKLSFLYVISPSQYSGYAGTGAVMATAALSNTKEQKELVQDHYMQILERNKDIISTDIAIERMVIEGPWVSGIIEYSEKYRPDLLILKHEGHKLIDKILGDANTELINAVGIPVMVIPEKADGSLPKKVAYLTDHRQKDINALKQLSILCKSIDAKIHVVHVGEDDFESVVKKKGFESILGEEIRDCKFSYDSILRDHLTENVHVLIEEKGFDLLVMLNESENFLNRFFSRSSVDKLMNSVEIPLTIYN